MPLLRPSTWSRDTKRRLVFYPSLLALSVSAVAFCTVMPGDGRASRAPGHDEALAAQRFHLDLATLAEDIGERNVTRRPRALAAAGAWIESELVAAKYEVRHQKWLESGVEVENLWVEIPGTTSPGEQIVVGAHYDSAEGAPGANDNGTGVVVLLALARDFAGLTPVQVPRLARSVRLVFFTNEEPPWFWTESMGSLHYARAARARGDDVRAMLSLETMGWYSHVPGSQRYPGVVRALYPDTGDFLGFVGALSSRSLLRDAVRAFRGEGVLPSEGAVLPAFVPGVGWSDHWAFAEVGYPAIMVTDTAVFRYPHYHTEQDTTDKIDRGSLARAHTGIRAVVTHLANAPR